MLVGSQNVDIIAFLARFVAWLCFGIEWLRSERGDISRLIGMMKFTCSVCSVFAGAGINTQKQCVLKPLCLIASFVSYVFQLHA